MRLTRPGVRSPDFTFVFGVHPGIEWAFKGLGKLLRVGQDADDPEFGGRMRILQQLQLLGLRSGLRAPNLHLKKMNAKPIKLKTFIEL